MIPACLVMPLLPALLCLNVHVIHLFKARKPPRQLLCSSADRNACSQSSLSSPLACRLSIVLDLAVCCRTFKMQLMLLGDLSKPVEPSDGVQSG